MSKNRSNIMKNDAGMTLVELMIAVALSGIVILAIYMSFQAQQKAATIQENISQMQQTIRGSLALLTSEIRMAGYNPDNDSSMIEISDANSTKITVEYWDDSDSEIDSVSFSFDTTENTLDRKKDAGSYEAAANNIEDLEFLYRLDDGSNSTAPATLTDIRSVTISLLARSHFADPNYTSNIVYQTASGINPVTGDANATATYGDGFRRRQIITTVNCRNMGL